MPEKIFKFVFALAILVFCIVIIAVFLLLIKVLFLMTPEVIIFGIKMTPEVPLVQ